MLPLRLSTAKAHLPWTPNIFEGLSILSRSGKTLTGKQKPGQPNCTEREVKDSSLLKTKSPGVLSNYLTRDGTALQKQIEKDLNKEL